MHHPLAGEGRTRQQQGRERRTGWGEVDGGATEVGGWQGESASSVALQSLPLLFPMRRSFSLVAAAAACVLTRFSFCQSTPI